MTLLWPTLNGGRERFPITRNSAQHEDAGQKPAVDIACDRWEPLLAPHAGYMSAEHNVGECGNRVQVVWSDDDGEWEAFYCHCEAFPGDYGDNVEAGAVIAYAGDSGLDLSTVPGAGGVHCHMGLSLNGVRVDPEPYLRAEEPMRRTPDQQSLIDRLRGYAAEYDAMVERLTVIAAEMRKDAERLEREEWVEIP